MYPRPLWSTGNSPSSRTVTCRIGCISDCLRWLGPRARCRCAVLPHVLSMRHKPSVQFGQIITRPVKQDSNSCQHGREGKPIGQSGRQSANDVAFDPHPGWEMRLRRRGEVGEAF